MENYNFCPKCGAKKITKRITFKNLIQEFSNRFLNLDNSLTRTFLHLFSQPKKVIDGYINGLRKRYLNVFSYFAISLTISGLYTFFIKKYKDDILLNSLSSEKQIEITKMTSDFSFEYQSVISLLIIPLLALISRFVFYNYKKYNLTEHFVIYLYAYSHITMVVSILTLPFIISFQSIFGVLGIQFVIYISYIAYVLKKLYGLSIKKIILKTLLFIVIVLILLLITSLISGLIMYKTGILSSIEK